MNENTANLLQRLHPLHGSVERWTLFRPVYRLVKLAPRVQAEESESTLDVAISV